ncbi:Osmotin-like protein TPM-1 [Gossypium arboreum]|uniref:Osmotin-like protein TPM-1 n=1 Tax=Gossypium arboreum TaxID=29729 RepID=A0A0B0NMJ9_GOSAR|nr:Osmotin-like protein TPM-1 [Gossypium arboreum]
MSDVMVYENDIVNEFDEYVISRKSRLNLRNNLGYNLRLKHYVQVFRVSNSIPSVQRYRQASSGIEGCQRLDHTINWTFRMPSSKHMGRDTGVCLCRVKGMALGHGHVPRPCEVCT